MISISKKDWSEKKVNQRLIDKISQDNNFSSFLSKLIASRNFREKLNVIATLKYNYFNNKKTYQLIILDLIL
jgi:hypothetical protein